jgi:hypothetical protein
MTNPTSNFGWQMPTSADLVTDLPADFEVFGQAVDTDFVDLLGGTTGQVLSKTSATDLDFTWINNDTGDITGVTAGTGISGGGTSGTVTVSIDTAVTADLTTSQTLTNKTLTSPALTTPTISTLTTNGDLLYGTGSGALARKAIGTTGQVLTVAAGIPSWATSSGGDMTLVTSAAFSSVTSVSLPNSTFTTANNVYVIYFILTAGTGAQTIRIRRRTGGTDTTNASYFTNGFKAQGGATTYITNPSETSWNTFMTTSSPEYQNGNQITIYQPMTQNNGHMSMNGITDNYAAAIVSGGYNGTGVTFDALTWFIPSGTMTGRYSVFKMTN